MWACTGGCAADAAARMLAGRRAQACIVRALHARARHAAHRRAVLAALANTDEATLAAPAAVDVFGQARAQACWFPSSAAVGRLAARALQGQRAQPASACEWQRPLGSHVQAEEPGTASIPARGCPGRRRAAWAVQLSGRRATRR